MTVMLGVLLAALALFILIALVLVAYDLCSYLHYRWSERSVANARDPHYPIGRHRR